MFQEIKAFIGRRSAMALLKMTVCDNLPLTQTALNVLTLVLSSDIGVIVLLLRED